MSDLRSRFDQLDAVCENATVALFAMDDRQHCVYMNRAAELLTGYRLGELGGRPLHDFIHHTYPDGSPFPIDECPIDRAAPSNALEQGEAVFVHRDGHFYPVAFTASPVRAADRVIGTVIEVRNIEAEQRVAAEQQAIRELAELLLREVGIEEVVQAVTDTATQLIGAQFGAFFYNTTDPDGESLTLYTISGVPKEHFSNFPMPRATPLFKPTFDGKPTLLIDDVLADRRYGQWDPHRGMPEGHLPVRSYLATPVSSDYGEVLGGLFFGHREPGRFTTHHVALVESIAAQAALGVSRANLVREARVARERAVAEAREKERLYQEAAHANEMKDLFLATVSHELRTPLTSILGWSDMLASGRLPADRVDSAVATIARNARAQVQIVDDLLDISRIVSGKLQLNVITISPAGVAQAAVESARPAAAARGIELECHFAHDCGLISADPDRLQQVVWNLLTNAVKFTERGGRVTLRLERDGSHMQIRVSDTGRGIEPAFIPRLFDRFSQRDAGTTREHGGLGLGLAIVRQLVEMHGGTVTASSPGPGMGATFVVRLPICAIRREGLSSTSPTGTASDAVHAAASLPHLENVRVLLVEDDTDSRELLTTVFESRGAQVHACSNAADALVALNHLTPTVVVSDIGMPGVDGYELIQRIRKREAISGATAVPAIALSAYAQAADRTRALACGFQTHVAKPVDPAELLTVVTSLLGWRNR